MNKTRLDLGHVAEHPACAKIWSRRRSRLARTFCDRRLDPSGKCMHLHVRFKVRHLIVFYHRHAGEVFSSLSNAVAHAMVAGRRRRGARKL
jgi:hypothetical protein